MKKTRVLAAIAFSLTLAAGAAYAFVLLQPPVKWASPPRHIEINQNGHGNVDSPDGDGGVSEIEASVAASWNQAVPGSLTTTSAVSSPPASIGDGISTMHFNVGGTGCSGGCLAITISPIPPSSPTQTVNGTDFRLMTDSDIFFNPATKYYSDDESNGCKREYHIETTAVHEVGHLLGLDHTPDSAANMYAFADFCDVVPLNSDDITGINCIYTNGTSGCGGCVSDTLVVDQTNCDQPSSGPNAGDFVVETFVVDNCGNAVEAADVIIDIPTAPGGPLSCSGTTSASGRLGCALDNPPDGLYESLVGDVSKTGFNNWNGSECGGVGQPPCGCNITIGGGGCVPTSNKEKGPKCSDGLDNDCDGLIDGADPDC